MHLVIRWVALIAAAAIAIVAAQEISMRWDEGDQALGPTVVPSATELPAPVPETPSPVDTPGEQTVIPNTPTATITAAVEASEEPTTQPTERPTAEPTDELTVPTPAPSGSPMPHTGGGAVGGGLALLVVAACVQVVLRRSY